MTNDSLIDRARAFESRGDTTAALNLLLEGEAAGDSRCATELGYWYLRGASVTRDLSAAQDHFRRAVALGNLDAAAVDIAMTANGSWGTPDWQAAIGALRRIAPLAGWASSDLALLEKMGLDEDGYPSRAIDSVILDAGLPVKRLPAFVSPEERQHIANRALPHLAPSVVFDPKSGRAISNPIRTSEGTLIGPAEEDLVLQAIYRRIARASGTDLLQGEPLSVLRYSPGQQYRPHFDAIHKVANNRVVTVIIYLNDGYQGGRTLFPDIPLRVEPVAGDAILFESLDSEGQLKLAAKHAGEAVEQGTKWIATRWIRQRAFHPWTEPAQTA